MDSPQPPKDLGLRNIIDKLAEFVARNGPEFETITKQKQQGNPKFEFLYGGEFASYYQFRKQSAEQAYIKNQSSYCSPVLPNQMGHQKLPQITDYSQLQVLNSCQQPQPMQQQWLSNITNSTLNVESNKLTITTQMDAINLQQSNLRDQIRQSESNLTAQHSTLLAQQSKQIEEAIDSAQNLFLEKLAAKNEIPLKDFDAVLQPIIESCTKDSISSGKNWILQHSSDSAKSNVVLQYLLKKALINGSTFQQKLHLIYLVNDILHHCIRKNAHDLKSNLENVVIPMFCSADLIATDDQRLKLSKLLSLWETKAKFFDACVITKLQSPDSSMQEYKTNLQNQHHEIISTFSQTTKNTLENYQKQHQIFIQHATQQISQLEQQKQHLEQQMLNSVLPNSSIAPTQIQTGRIPSLMAQQVLMPSVENFEKIKSNNIDDDTYNEANSKLFQQKQNSCYVPTSNAQSLSLQTNSFSSESQNNFFIPDLTKPPPGFLGNTSTFVAQLPPSLQQQFVQISNISTPNSANSTLKDNSSLISPNVSFDLVTLNAALQLVNQQHHQQHSSESLIQSTLIDEEVPPPAPRISDDANLSYLFYYELPAGLMVPLIRLEDYNYKSLDPVEMQLPIVPAQNERLTNALTAFYSPPTHDRPRDTEGWEKLGLYEYYKVKNAAKKQKEEEINNGLRQKSRSPSPIISEKQKQKKSKRCYRSKSRTRSPLFKRSRSRSRSPTYIKDNRLGRNNKQNQWNPSPRRSPIRDSENENYENRVDRNNIKRDSEYSNSPPSFNTNFTNTDDFYQETPSANGYKSQPKVIWSGSETDVCAKNLNFEQSVSRGELSKERKGVGINSNDPFENFRKNKGVAFVHRMRTRDDKN